MNREDQARILERVRKLLALANSANEHEARAAAEKANELLVRYNLDMQQVTAGDPDDLDGYDHVVAYDAAKRTPQQKFILPLIQRHFFVDVIRSRRFRGGPVQFIFVGERTNVQVAVYVHDFLLRQFPLLWDAYRAATHAPASARQSYWTGLMEGLTVQLGSRRKRVERETGLVVVKDPKVALAVDRFVGQVKRGGSGWKYDGADGAARAAGQADGAKLNIQRGLGESAAAPAGGRLALGGKKA